ncbi:hypothetical protein BB561_000296 [Smittium simulii]|uniref:Uncharacterized protein n=1 Tax=Smittium simulii TaxID=133385 RepID=A0A2T9YZX1_9FUNG|nr:hypothetical protein BB561_000296 [Smittium simulii]
MDKLTSLIQDMNLVTFPDELFFTEEDILSPIDSIPKLIQLLEYLASTLNCAHSDIQTEFQTFFDELRVVTNSYILNNSDKELVLACKLVCSDTILSLVCNDELYPTKCSVLAQESRPSIPVKSQILPHFTNPGGMCRDIIISSDKCKSGILVLTDVIEVAQKILNNLSALFYANNEESKMSPCLQLLSYKSSCFYMDFLLAIKNQYFDILNFSRLSIIKNTNAQQTIDNFRKAFFLLIVSSVAVFLPQSTRDIEYIILDKFYPDFLKARKNKVFTTSETLKITTTASKYNFYDNLVHSTENSSFYTRFKTDLLEFTCDKMIFEPNFIIEILEKHVKSVLPWIVYTTLTNDKDSTQKIKTLYLKKINLEQIIKILSELLESNRVMDTFYAACIWSFNQKNRHISKITSTEKLIQILNASYKTILNFLKNFEDKTEHSIIRILMQQNSIPQARSCLVSILRKNIYLGSEISKNLVNINNLKEYYLEQCGEIAELEFYQSNLGDLYVIRNTSKYFTKFIEIILNHKKTNYDMVQSDLIIGKIKLLLEFYYLYCNIWLELLLLASYANRLQKSVSAQSKEHCQDYEPQKLFDFFYNISQIISSFLDTLINNETNKKQLKLWSCSYGENEAAVLDYLVSFLNSIKTD